MRLFGHTTRLFVAPGAPTIATLLLVAGGLAGAPTALASTLSLDELREMKNRILAEHARAQGLHASQKRHPPLRG